MALIKCPECKREVSSRAKQCASCGFPISGNSTKGSVQTIQATSKVWKAQQILAGFLVGLGVVVMFAANTFEDIPANDDKASQFILCGLLLIVFGAIWFFVARFYAWWHHG